MIADRLCLDAEMIQQRARAPRVLAGDQLNFAKHSQCAPADVFKISNRSRDDIESSRHFGIVPSQAAEAKRVRSPVCQKPDREGGHD